MCFHPYQSWRCTQREVIWLKGQVSLSWFYCFYPSLSAKSPLWPILDIHLSWSKEMLLKSSSGHPNLAGLKPTLFPTHVRLGPETAVRTQLNDSCFLPNILLG